MRLEGRIFRAGAFAPGRLRVEDARIASVEPLAATESDCLIVPGFVDLHVHGFGGCDPLEDLAGMSLALARAGTTGFQPTLFPAAPQVLGECAQRVQAQFGACTGARPLGLHLEGPFVNPEAAGALPKDDLATPSLAGLRAIVGPATGDGRGIRTITIAPELPGSAELIEELARMDIRASMGHSTATEDAARAGANAGAVGATHLFNAMRGVHHRDAGLAGFALLERTLYAEIIGDLVHVGERAFDLALRAHGPASLCLVSDALRGAGTGCDVFHSHGRDHVIRDGTAYYPADATRAEDQLAGSASSQLEMVRKLVARGVVSLEDAITMASFAPARALGLEGTAGELAPGRAADWLVLDPDSLDLLEVVVGGRRVDSRESGE